MIAYPFGGNDINEAYAQSRKFIRGLEEQLHLSIPRDDIRGTTKYYPDHGATYTFVEVFVPSLFTDAVEELYKLAITPEPEPPGTDSELILKARALLAQRKAPLVLEHIVDEGWRLRSDRTTDLSIVFWGLTSEENILDAVKNHLGIKDTNPADDFDPFLDSDDLP